MKSLFLIIGAPGSGKTTDASLIAQANDNMVHYSTGDLLRSEIAKKSELGKKINDYISKGNLVPLEIVTSTIVDAIKNSKQDYIIIDGYPRSVEQMTELDKILSKNGSVALKGVIEVDVSKEVAEERVLGRARGDDDNKEVFENRMSVFLNPLKEIREFYKEKKIYHIINAERTIEEIVADISKLLKKIS